MKKQNFSQELSLDEFREIIKSFCDIGLIESKTKSKAKSKSYNQYRVKYSVEDLEVIFVDDKLFNMFKPVDKGNKINK
jgi:hypothetical protein